MFHILYIHQSTLYRHYFNLKCVSAYSHILQMYLLNWFNFIVFPQFLFSLWFSSEAEIMLKDLKEYTWLLRWLRGKESLCLCRRHGFDPWVGRIPWRRKWQPIPVFLPGESHGQMSLMGYSPWDRSQTRQSTHALWYSPNILRIWTRDNCWIYHLNFRLNETNSYTPTA